jgi:hypothetical protein
VICVESKFDSEEFLEQVSAELPSASAERRARRLTTRAVSVGSIRPIKDFHNASRYGGDHRADIAWAVHAASRKLSQQTIRAEILYARDLSKKVGLDGNFNIRIEQPQRQSHRTVPSTVVAAGGKLARV